MIRKLTPPFFAAAVLALCAPAASAQDAVEWKSVGDWEISIDTTIGNGCYAVATWNGGTVLRIGLNPVESNFYMLLGNDAWTSLRPDVPYAIRIQFDRAAPWDVSAFGLQFAPGETVYLHAESGKFDFLEEFMAKSNMKISYQGNVIDTLRLSGSRRAFTEVMACQESVDQNGLPGGDPFAGAGKKPRADAPADPFAD